VLKSSPNVLLLFKFSEKWQKKTTAQYVGENSPNLVTLRADGGSILPFNTNRSKIAANLCRPATLKTVLRLNNYESFFLKKAFFIRPLSFTGSIML
jgi:hypothetical protein